MPYYNKSHMADNTAGQALLRIESQEPEASRRKRTIDSMLVFAKKHGYKVTSRIVLERFDENEDAVHGL